MKNLLENSITILQGFSLENILDEQLTKVKVVSLVVFREKSIVEIHVEISGETLRDSIKNVLNQSE